MEVEQLPFIPEEIVVKILSRLQVKTLLRFKSVCKRWYHIISHPQFVTMHLNLSKQTERILLSSDEHILVNPLYSIDSKASYDHHRIDKIDFPSEDPSYMGYIVGSCNGLLLIVYEDRKLFLWNPFTREFREIPYPHSSTNFFGANLYGLGYNSAADDYHLVVVLFVDELDCSFLVYVFTLKTNKWKKNIEICPYEFCDCRTKTAAAFVNGSLHWVMIDSIDGDSHKVVFFDLADEKLKDISLPNSLDTRNDLCLGVLGSCICVVSVVGEDSVRRAVKVWVMKEYGVKESWTNLINFTYNESLGYISPFCYTRNGDLVVELKGKNMLMVVDCERKAFGVILVVHKVHEMPFTHVETLVSVHGNHGSLKRCLKSFDCACSL